MHHNDKNKPMNFRIYIFTKSNPIVKHRTKSSCYELSVIAARTKWTNAHFSLHPIWNESLLGKWRHEKQMLSITYRTIRMCYQSLNLFVLILGFLCVCVSPVSLVLIVCIVTLCPTAHRNLIRSIFHHKLWWGISRLQSIYIYMFAWKGVCIWSPH